MIKDKLTIVIPSKNEGFTLYESIKYLSKQTNLQGTKVIIADVSDDENSLHWINTIKVDFKYSLNIQVIEGGYPAQGRLNGSKLATTPYILFLDADIMLTEPTIIEKSLSVDKQLVTVPFETDRPYRWVFRMFDLFQLISTLLGTPFAVGGYQLWKRDKYWNLGGYDPTELFAEDYSLSQKVKSNEFKVVKIKGVYTSARRFKNKGIIYMFNIMIKSYINRNNPKFFKESHNYWA